MKTRKEYIDTLRAHETDLRNRFGVRSMRLFGSVARNEHKEGSDVDLFVEMPPKFFQACAAADYLEDLLGCHVDLVRNHKNLSDFFLKQIERDGINVYPQS